MVQDWCRAGEFWNRNTRLFGDVKQNEWFLLKDLSLGVKSVITEGPLLPTLLSEPYIIFCRSMELFSPASPFTQLPPESLVSQRTKTSPWRQLVVQGST